MLAQQAGRGSEHDRAGLVDLRVRREDHAPRRRESEEHWGRVNLE